MQRNLSIAGLCAAVWLSVALPAGAEKAPDLGRTKFRDIAKYLNLTRDQQQKIKNDVERIRDIVKRADKQRGTTGFGAGGRTPIGAGRWGAPGGTGSQGGVQVGDVEQRRLQRQEWQKEITNRVDEIKSFLTPPQLEKFKAIRIPDILSQPSGG